jgi:hypothetical protein
MSYVNAIELMEAQHGELRELFDETESAVRMDDKQALFDELADRLTLHFKVEEEHLHAAVRAAKHGHGGDDSEQDEPHDHRPIKRLVLALMDGGVEAASFAPALGRLRREVERHIREEASQLLTDARELLAEPDLLALGDEMVSTQLALESEAPRALLAAELDPAAARI